MNRLQEWILFYLIDREKRGITTKGRDLFFPSDVEPLLDLGMIEIEQSHEVDSLLKTIMVTTTVRLTEKGRNYFER
jgi:hypothetical protein